MKNIKELQLNLAEKIDIPSDMIPGSGRLSILAGRQALVEECRGLLEYSQERVVLALSGGKIILSGSGLCLKAMSGGDILVIGRIQNVEWC